MTKFRITFTAVPTDQSCKISDIKDFRSLFTHPSSTTPGVPLLFAKNFIEALYNNQTQILEVSLEQLGLFMFNRHNLPVGRPYGFTIGDITPVDPDPRVWELETY